MTYNWQAAVNSYTYTAVIEQNSPYEILFKYDSGVLGGDKHEILADVARFLGAVYYGGHATSIAWGGNDYTWDPASAGNLKGSNWWNGTINKTLVASLTAWFAANPSATEIVLTINGVDTTLKLASL